jgi:ABC-2 type transport system ATP-binding protein
LWIEWSHVTKTYQLKNRTSWTKSTIGLLDFTAVVRAGVTAVLGPKGSGKTTLLRLTAATLLPDDGRITFETHDANRLVWSRAVVTEGNVSRLGDWRQQVSYLPAKPTFPYEETVEKTLRYLAQVRRVGSPRKYAAECIAKWGLAAWRKYSVAELPSPIRKRFALAICFAKHSPILLLDEPTIGLDPVGKHILWKEIRQQTKQRLILLATSDLAFAECADDLILMERGACRRYGYLKYLTASVREGTVESWYHMMQTFSSGWMQQK